MASRSGLTTARRQVLLYLRRNMQSSHLPTDKKALWTEINRLASEGKWDAINNKPEMFLFGDKKKDAYGVYKIFNHSTNFFDGTPYGPPLYLIWRISLAFGVVWLGVKIYEFIVPEQKRLKYKYRNLHGGHGHEEAEHGHAESHGHH